MKTLADLTAPATPTRKLLEKDVQKACIDWLRARGWWCRKFSSMSQTSVPDYLCAKGKIKFAVEFKRPGNAPTAAQEDEMQAMRTAGWIVFWTDSVEAFKQHVEELERDFA